MDTMIADSVSKISDSFPKGQKMIDFLTAPIFAGGCNFQMAGSLFDLQNSVSEATINNIDAAFEEYRKQKQLHQTAIMK